MLGSTEPEDEIAAADAEGYVFIPPRPSEENHLDLMIERNQQLIETLFAPYYMRVERSRQSQ